MASRAAQAPQSFDAALTAALATYGTALKSKLRGPGDPEDQLRAPTERLVSDIAAALGLDAVLHGEVRLVDLEARPDYGVDVAGAPVGYIEIKRPGKGANPDEFTGHNARQWQKLKLLPNVLYTDGNEWALYRNGKRVGDIAALNKSVRVAGSSLASTDGGFARVLRSFLLWKPSPPRSLLQLVRAISNLCSLLRSEVELSLTQENAGAKSALFSLLAEDWRNLLFPDASDEAFADQYAQTVTFALLLARVEKIDFATRDIAAIARDLGKKHSLMGKALAVLTDESNGGLGVSLEALVEVIGAVDWEKLDNGNGDAYLHLYETFLAQYDSSLRQRTGSYYTPNEAVSFMVGFVDEVLRKRLHKGSGVASPGVVVVDPAMGTGTFLLNIMRKFSETVRSEEGDGSVGPRLRDFTSKQLIGFEKQTGPYAVAELRMYQALHEQGASADTSGLRIYVADTLDNPYAAQTQLGAMYEPIARSRRDANRVKREEPVLVVLGNPPYKDKASGLGGWIENGEIGAGQPAPLKDFLPRVTDAKVGAHLKHLKNLYVYFWRWATWKVFDAHPDFPSGVVAFITPSGYCTGPGFGPMREYLRRAADEAWIINVSPEGHRPDIPTRFFSGVQEPLTIAVFTRSGAGDPEKPAVVHYTEMFGKRAEKFTALEGVTLDSANWTTCSNGWQEPFRPAVAEHWGQYPLLEDIMPWFVPGVKANRTWVMNPSREILTARWQRLVRAQEADKSELFHESRDANLKRRKDSLEERNVRLPAFADEASLTPPLARYSYRSFDRQWVISDPRLMNDPRPTLWGSRSESQIFVSELHAHPIKSGPGLTFSAYVQDMDHYKGSEGGRVFPLYRDSAGSAANFAPRLATFLSDHLGIPVPPEDLLAYIAGVVAHSAYTVRFSEALKTPKIRIPLTRSAERWKEAVELGRRVVWLHTYGERFADPANGRPAKLQLPESRRPLVTVGIPDDTENMPDRISHRGDVLEVGAGRISPVPENVWNFDVSGMSVVKKWFGYRRQNPGGRKSSDLDRIKAESWHPQNTTDLLQLLNILGLLRDQEEEQEKLLESICSGPCFTVDELMAGEVLPVTSESRRPIEDDEGALF